jgi:glycosyltransferase involved in cell wall biosynthesis
MGLKVTALICTYNGKSRGFIDFAIKSIQRQTRRVDQIIVVDDGSTDDTVSHIGSNYPSIEILSIKKSGVSSARNLGLSVATGDLIAFLDDDDLWADERIAETLKPYEQDPLLLQSTIVFTASKVFYGDDPDNGTFVDSRSFYATWPACLLGPVVDGNGGVMLPKNLFLKIGLFRKDLVNGEDRDYWHRAILSGMKFMQIQKPLFYYRKSHLSATSSRNYDEQILRFISDQIVYDRNLWGDPILFQLAFAALLRAVSRMDFSMALRLLLIMNDNLSGISPVAMLYRIGSLALSANIKWKNRLRKLETAAVTERCKSRVAEGGGS